MILLMVNDEMITAESMKKDMDWELYGIDAVYTAYNAEEAKRFLSSNPADILLCDIEMPGENGLELLRWCRERRLKIECIFLTCHAAFDYAKEAIQLDCQDYLVLPAKYEDIGNAVLKVVTRIAAQRESERFQMYGRQVLQEKQNQAVEQYGEKKSSEEKVQEVISHILENLGNESLSVSDIADKMCLHPIYLNRIFKKITGLPISQYIIQERMRVAGELLADGKLEAATVSQMVGYMNYSNFNLTFKKYYGCSPGRYKDSGSNIG